MKVSCAWLGEWFDQEFDPRELAARLTMAGLEVESVMPLTADFTGVVVGRVLEVAPHPAADKLRVCRVDAGQGHLLTIVCGAPNVYAGMRAPVALVGARLPGGVEIGRARLRGVESEGMLCSARELGIADDAAGLLELPADAPLGVALAQCLALPDTVLELSITPNRGDCLGMLGVAREVGALTGRPLRVPPPVTVEAGCDVSLPVRVDTPADCPVYAGRVVRGLNTEAVTPLWLCERLRRAGIRPIHPVVDVTNYVMLELGQPLHAFDLDALDGGIVVRRARPGERLTLLDGTDAALDANTLVICDHAGPQAVAGVMGGHASAVSQRTRNIFLESAFFAPLVMAGRARRLNVRSDAAQRFERGVEPGLQLRALERATQLLLQIAGGEAGPVVSVRSETHLPVRSDIALRRERIERLLGMRVPDERVETILRALGMEPVRTADGWTVRAPAWRFDLAIEEDLIEEVGRIHGYDHIPAADYLAPIRPLPCPENQVPLGRLREVLVQRGYQEAITYSFVDPAVQSLLFPEPASAVLTNPIASDLAVMRLSLWPGLLGAARHNLNRQVEQVRLFESGVKFSLQGIDIKEEKVLAGIVCGAANPRQWALAARPVDFADIKGDVESLLALGGLGGWRFVPAEHPALHPGQAARIEREGRVAGWIGALHPRVLQALDLETAVYLFELDLAALSQRRRPKALPVSPYPAVQRDLAVVVEEDVSAQRLLETVQQAAGSVLQEVRLFDIYRGPGIDSGRKSVALSLILQDSSRTLTDEAVDRIMADVISGLRAALGAVLRE